MNDIQVSADVILICGDTGVKFCVILHHHSEHFLELMSNNCVVHIKLND
jgi:hypothetical protein